MTDLFLQNLESIINNVIPDEIYLQTRRAFIDYLGCTVAGASSSKEKESEYLSYIHEYGDASVLCRCQRTTIQTAALLNGISGHVLELDDGHRKGAIHVGSTVFSALLAVAEHEKLSSSDFFLGAIIGYEATIRLACAIQPGNKLRGYHATGTCGTVGAALGIAAALHFDQEQMKSALSAAVTSAAGVLEMQEDGSDYKPLNVGRAAMDAVSAAYLGRARFKAPKDAIGGKRGFLKVMTDDPHPEFLTEYDPHAPLAIMQIYQKTYAACRHTHPAIEAALTLRPQLLREGCIEEIDSITVEAYRLAVGGHDHTEILGISSAKMSMPFSVALAILRGSAGMADYNEANVSDEAILALTQKVKVVENEELSALVPNKRASILHVRMKNGQVLTHRVDYPKGEPENPLSQEELEQKFRSLALASGLTQERCDQVIEMLGLPSFQINDLIELIS